ncbi:MAG: pyridoxal phosphate-dependent aminotransferase [Oscillospiraceae bacterium]|nr:pyridoxal phosphate-dependent aminotransferase [Oscillospiraceae bacterium]
MVLPESTVKLGTSKSCIRELAAYGAVRKAEIGAENVFDFSLGNPSIPAPDCVNETIAELLKGDSVQLHGYTSAAGNDSLRKAIADDLNARFGTHMEAGLIFVTVGCAGALAISFKATLLSGDEVVALAPFFPEYKVYVENAGGTLVTVQPREGDFQLNLEGLEAAVTERTKAVIINSPNNPSGVILSAESLTELAQVLHTAEAKYGHEIFLICDEPYRELAYDGQEVPCVFHFYENTILCYSFSKSMSLPGERIGYIAVNDRMPERSLVFTSIQGAARSLGYVNAPSLMQRVIEKCLGATSDVSKYKENRDLLVDGLRAMGYQCVRPDGAFYLFVKSPIPDANVFSEHAKKYELLLVPSDDFGCPGYVRIAYCVSRDMIERAMPHFKQLAIEYGLTK